MDKNKVLVDSSIFKRRLEELIPAAKKQVYIQAMTFEGDSVGSWLINLLLQSNAKDIRLCIDSYSTFVINDHFVLSPKYLLDKEFREEVRQTHKLLKLARENGIKVTITNPLGFLFTKYPFRNHKKIVVVDDVSFLGGINFSEHNFEWHDMMLEFHNSDLSGFLKEDIQYTGISVNQDTKVTANNFELYLLDGWISREKYQDIFMAMRNAKKSIHIFSPYLSDPLLNFVRNKTSNEVEVNVISPSQNNKSLFKSLLLNELSKGYFTLWMLQNKMSHLKAILVDDEILIAGSSNFDFVSYYFEQEVVVVTRDPHIVSNFIEKIKLPDLKESVQLQYNSQNHFAAFAYQLIKGSCWLLAMINSIFPKLSGQRQSN